MFQNCQLSTSHLVVNLLADAKVSFVASKGVRKSSNGHRASVLSVLMTDGRAEARVSPVEHLSRLKRYNIGVQTASELTD